MNILTLSAETLRLLESQKTPGNTWRSDAIKRADGLFDVPVCDEVAERLEQVRFATESDDDVIQRLCLMANHGGRPQ